MIVSQSSVTQSVGSGEHQFRQINDGIIYTALFIFESCLYCKSANTRWKILQDSYYKILPVRPFGPRIPLRNQDASGIATLQSDQ